MYTHDELVWLAGFLDGDGCFTSAQNSGTFIRIAHTHLPTLTFIKEKFGGSLNEHNHGRPAHYKRVWRWMVCGDVAKELALSVIPYLKEKKPQAELLVAIMDMRVGRGHRPTLTQRELRKTLVNRLKELKHENKSNVG